jgi:hypothetical protein
MLDYRVRARLSVADAVLGQVADRSPASVRRYGCALRSFLPALLLARRRRRP